MELKGAFKEEETGRVGLGEVRFTGGQVDEKLTYTRVTGELDDVLGRLDAGWGFPGYYHS